MIRVSATFPKSKSWLPMTIIILLTCQSVSSVVESELDDLVTGLFMTSSNIPGLGLAIVEENANVIAKGYGFSDLEGGSLVTNLTKFSIASITKTFTAVLVVKVLNEKFPELGPSVLDTPIRDLYPNGNFTFSDRYRSETMTFRDLLSHRHGIRDDGLGMNSGTSIDSDEYAYRTRYAKEAVPFRTYGSYNNAMYSLMGKLIGELAGSSYVDLLENLLSEIGMTDSSYIKESEDYNSFPNMSKGYFSKDGQLVPYNSWLLNRLHVAVPAGGIITTPADMIKYMTFHLQMGRVGDKQIVPQDVMGWLSQPSLALNSVNFKETPTDKIEGQLAVGTGYAIGIYDGYVFYHHSGSWSPFTSRMVLYPALNLGIFTVANGPSVIHEAQYNFEYLHREIINLIQGVSLSKSAKNPHRAKATPPPVQFAPSYNQRIEIDQSTLAGIFGNPVEGEMEITYTPGNPNGTLYMKLGQWATGSLTPYQGSSTTFLINWDSDIVQDFYFATGALIDVLIDVRDDNTLVFVFGEEQFEFKRGETLDTFPEIPWDSGSCGPINLF